MSELKTKIYLDGKLFTICKYKEEDSLKNLREMISKKISSDFLFSYENDSIEKDNEENFSINDCQEDNKIFIISNKTVKTIPVNGSIKKETIDDVTFYLYPNIELNEIEKIDSKNILLIGKSGDGKTTFLNALINVLLDIKGEDKIRYKLVFEENEKGQYMSQTNKINIYNIKTHGNPILRIIDTPGFFDTEGKDLKESYFNEFKELFQKEIAYLNCICFIINFSSVRYNETQKELFNRVTCLFSQEIKNNFVFIFTHYTSTGKVDVSLSLSQNEIFKDIIDENNKFKVDSESAFVGDKNIRNIIWDNTTKEIQRLLEEKINILNPVNTAQSAEVIERRKMLRETFKEKLIEFKNKLNEIQNLLEEEKRKSLKITIRKKEEIETKTKNTNCKKCKKTCHKNCDCTLLLNIRYFCNIFGFLGFCDNCNCYFARHLSENKKYVEKKITINFKDEEEKEKNEANEIQTKFNIT